uniref:Uncharacterized protein n=1 Tax=Rhizophora mucronata TaxID=61149 RepID=A0A2P2NQQ3_RHIMU
MTDMGVTNSQEKTIYLSRFGNFPVHTIMGSS